MLWMNVYCKTLQLAARITSLSQCLNWVYYAQVTYIPDERVRMSDVVVTLNKIKKDYSRSTAVTGATSFGDDN